ncbi:bifunctional aspartate kinase/homoserine dehydrogenase I [Buchnera aphidicola]|uniref:Bifunctional aspartokinase/homoserine dehydrogenase n=1 Tax=Buchnera aphidicola (Anoecia oenotherae) TaxID=1241833 RepID=A0A4D6Y0A8_9GAMM|nr:bifunctional aspartate kinase/homoserine dehydrogenase I [Buchnera aphidicola]QCI19291.1 bifunctional aspartate kinase/homoserine dehydrogenase I [Buchnera aphidicola (Anoecia oenotherae)]
MRTLKFGGTSLKDAQNFLNVFKIIIEKAKEEQISVVLSAPATITDSLEKLINMAVRKENFSCKLNIMYQFFYDLLLELYSEKSNNYFESSVLLIKKLFEKIKDLLFCISFLQECSKKTYAKIMSTGEIFSIEIMNLLFLSKDFTVRIIDPIDVFFAIISRSGNVFIDIKKSQKKIKSLKISKKDIILMPGFIAGNSKKELVLLGRNGSDYSASVLSVCLDSSHCEIWTDVNGVYSFDPRIIKNAKLLEYLSYDEAIELSYFGAKVLHPKTIKPLKNFSIACLIKNSLKPKEKGTLVSNTILNSNSLCIKGITHLNKVTMVKFCTVSNEENYDIFSRVFSKVFSSNKLSILLVNKSFFKNEVVFYIYDKYKEYLQNILENEFELEIKNKIIYPISITNGLSIVSVVGINKFNTLRIFTQIFSALSNLEINIVDLVYGISRRSLSIVIEENFLLQVVKYLHERLFYINKIIEIFLIGVGNVGSTLLTQIYHQKNFLKKKNINLKVCGIANSKYILTDINGINYKKWKKDLLNSSTSFSVDKLIDFKKNNTLFNPVIVDCTSDTVITKNYCNFFKNNFNVVTSNKKANTSSIKLYNDIRNTACKYRKKFLYETNVGAGLPIIKTLKKLLISGDYLIKFKGILSGSLSFVFGQLEEGILFSKAVTKARKMGFTEPHPYEDLSGIDVARKLLILSREVGNYIELKDIKIQSIIPQYFENIKDKENFMNKLKELDAYFLNLVKQANKEGKVLRFVGTINENKECCVKIRFIEKSDPLYTVKNGENALSLYSKYYNPLPLVLRGYGAGNNVTASGVFSDLLCTLS